MCQQFTCFYVEEELDLEIGSMLKMVLDAESQLMIHEFLIHPDKIETSEEIGKGTMTFFCIYG